MSRQQWCMVLIVALALGLGRAWPPSVVAAPAPAGAQAEGYYTLGATTLAPFRTVTSGAEDSADLDDAVDPQPTGGNPSCYVSGTFSDAGATATVVIVLRNTTASGTVAGVAYLGTMTASTSITYDTGRYAATTIIGTDCRSAQYYDVSVLDVSAGTFQLQGWTSGSQPTGAQ